MASVAEMLSEKYKVALSTEAIQKFNAEFLRREYQKDEIIVNLNKICKDVYIVEKGMVRQFYYKEGRDISEHFSCETDVVYCIESLFLKEPTVLLMEAIEPSVIYHLNYEKFEELCDQYTDINKLYRRIIEFDLM